MRAENRNMKEFLAKNGIDAMPKRINTGSLKDTWRLYNLKIKWFGNYELIEKLHDLGFVDFDGKPFSNFSGNGGVFSIFTRIPKGLDAQLTTVNR